MRQGFSKSVVIYKVHINKRLEYFFTAFRSFNWRI
jgi:hypothetical protein